MFPAIKLVLPFPPSVNNYYRSMCVRGKKAPIVYMSAEAKKYRELVAMACVDEDRSRWPVLGPLQVQVVLNYRTRRRIDLDNRMKGLLDCLTHVGVIEDDSQIDHLVVERGALVRAGRCTVLIDEIAGPLFENELA